MTTLSFERLKYNNNNSLQKKEEFWNIIINTIWKDCYFEEN